MLFCIFDPSRSCMALFYDRSCAKSGW